MRALDATRAIRRVGRRIAELRLARGWTQEKFAERASVSLKYVQRIEAGRENLTIRSLVTVAHILRVPVAGLFEVPATLKSIRGRPRKL